MNEIKNIKEIAKIIDKSRKLYVEDYESISMYYTPDEYFAKNIIEKGYQNCQDKVVLTKEEYIENDRLMKLLEEKRLDELKSIHKIFDKIRQETAREIFAKLQVIGKIITEFDWNDYLKIDVDDFHKLAQKYGVEIDNE